MSSVAQAMGPETPPASQEPAVRSLERAAETEGNGGPLSAIVIAVIITLIGFLFLLGKGHMCTNSDDIIRTSLGVIHEKGISRLTVTA
jgi:hypothetical protein